MTATAKKKEVDAQALASFFFVMGHATMNPSNGNAVAIWFVCAMLMHENPPYFMRKQGFRVLLPLPKKNPRS